MVGDARPIKVAFRNVFNDTPGKRFDWKTTVSEAIVGRTISEAEAILSWQGNFRINRVGDLKTHTENDWSFKSARQGDRGDHFIDNFDRNADVTIFFVKDAVLKQGETGSTAGISYGNIILIEERYAADSSILAHELMHFCGLPHVTGKNKDAGIPANTELKDNLMQESTGKIGGRYGSNLNVYQIARAVNPVQWRCTAMKVCRH
ncbi:MAG: hypothetical protein KDA85_11140 [Planctomycetaceae bacterium]|nr:hypothetical protein [Planctomycetaceae bacterium]